jgi:penicillin-binding protein 1B
MARRNLKRKHSRSRKPSRQNKNRKSPWAIAGIAAGVLFVLSVLYVAYLDAVIRIKFEGKRWSLPARVYARPLELYPGEALNKAQLLEELRYLNYRTGREAPGTYRDRGKAVTINTRGFSFWDGDEAPRRLNITFAQNRIEEILNVENGRTLSLLRLEPAQIASIYPTHKEDRDLIRLEEAPDLLVEGLLAVEDKDFYSHSGIKPTAILRALIANIRAGETVQGGSTLTQQLVKNFFLSNERTLRRKAVEAIMALLLEWHYEKDEILEAYLNEVHLGQRGDQAIHGFGLASRYYFDRPLGELKAEQTALLIALAKGASYYNPRRHPERALQRRNLVIDVMAAEELLAPEPARSARLSPLDVRPAAGVFSYPAFLELVKRQLREHYRDEDLRTEGLRIFTNFNPHIQQAAERALREQLKRLERQRGLEPDTLQGAVVVTSTDNGEVLAVVGDRNPRYDGYNRALDAVRPIGSLVKPAVYLTALQHTGLFTPVTAIEDTPLEVESPPGTMWEPGNYDREFHGEVPLAHGLVHSYNVATARLGMQVGVESVVANLEEMGVERTPPPYPSALLGAVELSPFEVTQMYQTLAGEGFYMPLRAVREVMTADVQRLNCSGLEVEQVFDPQPVYMVNRLLQQVVERGTARAVGGRFPQLQAAGKTGTSNELRDAWFAGFTGSHLAVVWIGRDENHPTGLSGAAGAVPVWAQLVDGIHTRPLTMRVPSGIEHVWIDWPSGHRSGPKCDNAVQLPFIMGTAPDKTAECRGQSWFKRLFD